MIVLFERIKAIKMCVHKAEKSMLKSCSIRFGRRRGAFICGIVAFSKGCVWQQSPLFFRGLYRDWATILKKRCWCCTNMVVVPQKLFFGLLLCVSLFSQEFCSLLTRFFSSFSPSFLLQSNKSSETNIIVYVVYKTFFNFLNHFFYWEVGLREADSRPAAKQEVETEIHYRPQIVCVMHRYL